MGEALGAVSTGLQDSGQRGTRAQAPRPRAAQLVVSACPVGSALPTEPRRLQDSPPPLHRLGLSRAGLGGASCWLFRGHLISPFVPGGRVRRSSGLRWPLMSPVTRSRQKAGGVGTGVLAAFLGPAVLL